MFYKVIMQIWSFVLDLASVSRLTTEEKDIEILLLRQRLRIVERRQQRGPHIPRWEMAPLAVLTCRLKTQAVLTRDKLQASLLLLSRTPSWAWSGGSGHSSSGASRDGPPSTRS